MNITIEKPEYLLIRNEQGSFYFNNKLDQKVYSTRKKDAKVSKGAKSHRQKTLFNHPYVNKYLCHKPTNKYIFVERVYKEYHYGWTIKMLYHNGNYSHGIAYVKNISCFMPYMIEHIQEDIEEYELIGNLDEV